MMEVSKPFMNMVSVLGLKETMSRKRCPLLVVYQLGQSSSSITRSNTSSLGTVKRVCPDHESGFRVIVLYDDESYAQITLKELDQKQCYDLGAMKPNDKITPIKDISPMVSNMRIKGRVVSIWHALKMNEAHNPYSLDLVLQDEEVYFYKNTNVTRIDQIDDNLSGFKNEPFSRILDTDEESEENNAVDVIGTIVGIGDVVAVNPICLNTAAVHIALFGTKLYINKQLPELLAFRQRYEVREEAVKKLVGSIRETEPDSDCVIYATVHSIQYENTWAYIGYEVCSKKVEPIASKGPTTSRTKHTWWCTKHYSQNQVASRYKMIVRVMDETGTAQLCIFDGNMHKLFGFTVWELDSEEDNEEDSEDVMTTLVVPIKSNKIENDILLLLFLEDIQIGHALDFYLVHSRYPILVDPNIERWLPRNWKKSGFVSGYIEAKRRKCKTTKAIKED
ncbi:replication protein A 70 kDa DNA-binding subunit B [Tanacetum coccineum]